MRTFAYSTANCRSSDVVPAVFHGNSGTAGARTWQETILDELDPVLEGVARYFSLLSDPTRLRIMNTICSTEKSVTQIVRETGATQTNVSRHLGTLYGAGVLRRRKSGNFIFYQVSDQTLIEICRTACVHFAARHEFDDRQGEKALSLADSFSAGLEDSAESHGAAGSGRIDR